MFAELRSGTARPQLVDLAKHSLTPEAVDHASWWHYSAALERDTVARRQRPTKEDVQATLEQVSEEAAAAGTDPKDPLALLSATVDYLAVRNHKQLTADTRAVYLKELRKHPGEGETVLIDHEVQTYIAENNLDVLPGSLEWRELAHRMMRAEIEALQRAQEPDAGDYAGQPRPHREAFPAPA